MRPVLHIALGMGVELSSRLAERTLISLATNTSSNGTASTKLLRQTQNQAAIGAPSTNIAEIPSLPPQ